MPFENGFMPIEKKSTPEIMLESKKEIIDYILTNIPGYTAEQMTMPIGDEQSTLSQFLEKANNGSEWTDPHGFKISVIENKFKILY